MYSADHRLIVKSFKLNGTNLVRVFDKVLAFADPHLFFTDLGGPRYLSLSERDELPSPHIDFCFFYIGPVPVTRIQQCFPLLSEPFSIILAIWVCTSIRRGLEEMQQFRLLWVIPFLNANWDEIFPSRLTITRKAWTVIFYFPMNQFVDRKLHVMILHIKQQLHILSIGRCCIH